jgi:hypothetical protein
MGVVALEEKRGAIFYNKGIHAGIPSMGVQNNWIIESERRLVREW